MWESIRKMLTAALIVVTAMTALTLSAPTEAEAQGWCHGILSGTYEEAKLSYQMKCNYPSNPQCTGFHMEAGWRWQCSGDSRYRHKTSSCRGMGGHQNKSHAISSFNWHCNDTYSSTSGYHKCTWMAEGEFAWWADQGWFCSRRAGM